MTANWVQLGESEGQKVKMELFHTLIAGQTNLSGKTTTIRTLVPRVVEQGFTVLIFDSKPTVREFTGYHDVPICYQSTTDSLVLLGLLEGIFRHKLTPFYATLDRLTEDASGIPDVIANAEKYEERPRQSGFIKDACHTLARLLARLQDELQQFDFTPDLQLRKGEINVMPINSLSVEAQQLVIKTAFEQVLKHHNRKVLAVLDETSRFLPQGYSSACKKAVYDTITQGAKTELYVWGATQFIATIEKDVIKAMANKLLGRQDDTTEVKATLDRIPNLKKSGIGVDQIMTLKRGEFVFVPIDGEVKKVYITDPVAESSQAVQYLSSPAPRHIPAYAPKFLPTSIPRKPVTIDPRGEKAGPREVVEGSPSSPIPGSTKSRASSEESRARSPPEEIDLDHKEIVVKVSHSEKVVPMDTDSMRGQVVFLLSEGPDLSLTINELIARAGEHGWAIPYDTASKSLIPSMQKDGLLVREGSLKHAGHYRLPRFVKFEVKVAEEVLA